mmetsp:Transcript_21353/g.42654  ORF Transcript_21353/g.42654 Transcript_21353/m.42654 type:complete len:123 (-) Transcript_21353:39-407(-)
MPSLSKRGARGAQANDDDDESFFLRRPKIQIRRRLPPPRTTLAAVLLLLGGLIVGSFGLHYYFTSSAPDLVEKGRDMIILGIIQLLPGSYASFMIFASFRQWPGYSYDQIPSYDDGSWTLSG